MNVQNFRYIESNHFLHLSSAILNFQIWIFLSRDAIAARRQVLQKKFNVKGRCYYSSSREYTESKIFESGISSIKRQIAFMMTLLVCKSGTIFRAQPVSNQSVKLVLRFSYAPSKTIRLSYRKCPVERFYGSVHARHYVTALRHTRTRQYGLRSTRSA